MKIKFSELILRFIKKAKEVLNKVDIINLIEEEMRIDVQFASILMRIDFQFKITINGHGLYILNFEGLSEGYPQILKDAIIRASIVQSQVKNSFSIIIAPYLSNKGLEMIQNAGLAGIDLCGNVYLKLPGIYIREFGHRNLYPHKRKHGSIFSRKGSCVIRTLILNPYKLWTVRKIAIMSGVSIGLVSYVTSRLRGTHILKYMKNNFRLMCPLRLIKLWSKEYIPPEHKPYFSPKNLKEVQEEIVNYCNSKNLKYGFTSITAAQLLLKGISSNQIFMYIDGFTNDIASELGWKYDTKNSNIFILTPWDESLFWGTKIIHNFNVLPDYQIYLDLISSEGKTSLEIAEKFMEERFMIERFREKNHCHIKLKNI